MTNKIRIATTWLDGCSGCHMSLLDLDLEIMELVRQFEIVYSPLVDAKEVPADIHATLVEGAVGNEDDKRKILLIRERSRIVIAFGDCAVTANVPGMRNQFGIEKVMERVYLENAQGGDFPTPGSLPALLNSVRPVHEYIHVDVFLPGCPPPPETIYFVITELLAGRTPNLTGKIRFGA